jgi:hypothetical protein
VQGGIEAMVRSIVAQALDEFVKKILPEKIQQAMAKIHQGSTAGMQGNLASIPIVEVMQMLGLQRQTGMLVINRMGDSVEVYFKNGAVVFASSKYNGSGTALEELLRKTCRIEEDSLRHAQRIAEMTSQPIDSILAQEKIFNTKTFGECLRRHTESAIYKVMAWKEGDFFFENAAAPVFSNPLQLKVDDLLLEGARRSDEWSLIQQKIPDFQLVFEPMIGNADELTTRGMSEVDMKVFSQVNGLQTIQDIIDRLNLSEFDVAKSMFILLSVNLIRRKR